MNAISSTPVERALALEALIRKHADQAERECRLPAVVADALSTSRLYRIGAPVAYGGEDASPLTQTETIETVSRFDGSAGWNLMIGIENFGLISPGCDSCKHMLEDPIVVLCSSTAAVGKAERDGATLLLLRTSELLIAMRQESLEPEAITYSAVIAHARWAHGGGGTRAPRGNKADLP